MKIKRSYIIRKLIVLAIVNIPFLLKGQTTKYATVEIWTHQSNTIFNHFCIVYDDGSHEFVEFTPTVFHPKDIDKSTETYLNFQVQKTQILNSMANKGYEIVIYSFEDPEITMIFKKDNIDESK